MPVLITVVPLNIVTSFLTGISVVPPVMRYGFYALGGVAAGCWLVLRFVRSAFWRLALACIPAIAIVTLLTDPADQHDFVRYVLVAILPLGALGWFSFARHVEDQAIGVGGWRRFFRVYARVRRP